VKAPHFLGLVIGLTVSVLSVASGDSQFFTAEHAEIWREHLVARGLLPERLPEPQTFARGPHHGFSQWGY